MNPNENSTPTRKYKRYDEAYCANPRQFEAGCGWKLERIAETPLIRGVGGMPDACELMDGRISASFTGAGSDTWPCEM